MTAAKWARRRSLPSILMSESQKVHRPHIWWKEVIKKQRLKWFDAALLVDRHIEIILYSSECHRNASR